jgi:Ribbon-helix-helix protein, copG family
MASKTRINFTIDRETLREAGRKARQRHLSRSALLREAIHSLSTKPDAKYMDEARKNRQRAAVEGIRQLARKAGNWPAGKILHSWRYRLEGKPR